MKDVSRIRHPWYFYTSYMEALSRRKKIFNKFNLLSHIEIKKPNKIKLLLSITYKNYL